MNPYAFIPLSALLVNVFAWSYIFAKNRRSPLNRAYLSFVGVIAWWNCIDFLCWSPLPDALLEGATRMSVFGWMPAGLLFLNFIHVVTNRARDRIWWITLVGVCVAIPLTLFTDLIVSGYTMYHWGANIDRTDLFGPVAAILIVYPALRGIFLLMRALREEKERRGAYGIVLGGAAAMLGLSVVTDLILPQLFGMKDAISLASVASVIFCIFIFWSVVKHRFLLIDLEEATQELFHQISDAVLVVDGQGRISLANKAAHALFNNENLITKNVKDLLADYDPFNKYYEDYETKTMDGRTTLAISQAPALHDQKSVGSIVIIRDLTKRQQLQEEIIKRQKLESIGILAGGIAHDFNNILTAIAVNIGSARLSIDPQTETYASLEQAEKSACKASQLTQQLLTFAKGGEPIRKRIRSEAFVTEATLFSLSGSKTRCDFRLHPDTWDLWGDEGQLRQVIHNLVLNAAQSMPQGGRMVVGTDNVTVNSGDGLLVAPGTYVSLTVIDHGEGIREEHLSRVFDPYFSTKPSGTGLGLASTYSIVQRHHGSISVSSTVGQGTQVKVLLPSARDPYVSVSPEQRTVRPRAHGRVLIMDDDLSVLRATARVLRQHGYEVLTARDGREALDLYRQERQKAGRIDVVIMDLTVPGGLGGRDAIKELLTLDPEARAIVASGYSNDPIMAHCEDYGFRGVVAKPYDVRQLLDAIEAARTPSDCPHPPSDSPR